MSATKQTLPKGWRWVKVGSLCNLVNGGAFKPSDWSTEGTKIIRIQNLNDDTKPFNYWAGTLHNQVLVKNGDILLAWSGTPGTSFGTHRWWRGSAILNQHIFRVDLSVDYVSPEWFVIATNFQLHVLISRAHGGVGLRHVKRGEVENLEIPLPLLDEQKRIAAYLDEQMRHIEQARQGIEEQLSLLTNLVNSYFRESLQRKTTKMHLSDCMVEVKKGVGETWAQYPVLGATRAGVAPAKEKVGKQPQRYKLVEPGTIFYNPMRIMIGSIAMLDDGDESGITSPDYVVLKGKEGILHPRWFYYWFRSPYGENFIKSLARGAVRERMLFNRLDKGEIDLPDWETQVKIAEKLKEIKTFKQALESQIAEINELPSALLRQAFAGEL